LERIKKPPRADQTLRGKQKEVLTAYENPTKSKEIG